MSCLNDLHEVIINNKQNFVLMKLKVLTRILTACILACSFTGCGSDIPSEKKDIVIRINNSEIILDEFNDMMRLEVYSDPELDLTVESRNQFIDYLVRKELMIQEAVRLRLDRKKNFIGTIEKYWEATLIRKLLDLKTEEMKKKVLITDDEIERYYVNNKAEFNQSFAKAKESIKRILESRKLEAKMEEWILSLSKSANIIINKKLIGQ